MAPSRTASFPWTSRLVMCVVSRSGRVVAVDVRGALRVGYAAMRVCPGNGGAAGDVRDVRPGLTYRRLGRGRFDRELARFVALGQDLDGEIGAEALAQAAADAVRRLDDGVMGKHCLLYTSD